MGRSQPMQGFPVPLLTQTFAGGAVGSSVARSFARMFAVGSGWASVGMIAIK